MSRVGVIGDTHCIESEYSCDRKGYPQKYCNRRGHATRHGRWLWEQEYEVELTSEQHLLHSCDNVKCVNLEHLRVGSHQENMADRRERNPYHGERNPKAKLTDKQARAILLDARTSPHVAAEYGVTPQAIRLVRQGRHFTHLQEQNMQPQRQQATKLGKTYPAGTA